MSKKCNDMQKRRYSKLIRKKSESKTDLYSEKIKDISFLNFLSFEI